MFIRGWNGQRLWVEMPDGGGNDGGGGDATAAFQSLLQKHNNDGVRVAEKLFDENYGYRGEIRQLKQQITDLTGKVPGEGAVVLVGEDATAWNTYKTLGKPDEVKQGLEQRAQLQGKLAGMERGELLRSVAETAGYNASTLIELDQLAKAKGKDLAFAVRDATVDGKQAKAAYVKDGDKELSLAEYAAANWQMFLPALSVQGTQQQQQEQSGTRFVNQHAGSGTQGDPNHVANYLKAQEEARAKQKNPLLKEQ